MDKQDQHTNGGGDLTQSRQSILEDTNINPMISECIHNIFRVVTLPEVHSVKTDSESLNFNQHETGNL